MNTPGEGAGALRGLSTARSRGLPGGPLQLGVGAGFMWGELDFTNDLNDQTGGWLQAAPRGSRSMHGTMSTATMPRCVCRFLAKATGFLLLMCSSFRSRVVTASIARPPIPTVPKYSVRWLPFNDELAFRATYSESFVAPTLFDLFGPISSGFTPSFSIQPYNASGNPVGPPTGPRQFRSPAVPTRTLIRPNPATGLRAWCGHRKPSKASRSRRTGSISMSEESDQHDPGHHHRERR